MVKDYLVFNPMNLYYAAAESALKELGQVQCKHILISMANGMKKIPLAKDHLPNDFKLIIDSGAFSYHKKGGITVEKWIAEAKKVSEYGTELISLDVIGNPKATLENYLEIKNELDVVPTFHVGSDISFLKKYLSFGHERICLGGMVPYKSQIDKLMSLLDEIFRYFSPEELPKFHAFGYFSPRILERYPFYSADASTWQNYSRFGEFHIFNEYEYLRKKSIRVENVKVRKQTIEDIFVYVEDDPILKLKKINKAINDYTYFLTSLWEKRGIKWN